MAVAELGEFEVEHGEFENVPAQHERVPVLSLTLDEHSVLLQHLRIQLAHLLAEDLIEPVDGWSSQPALQPLNNVCIHLQHLLLAVGIGSHVHELFQLRRVHLLILGCYEQTSGPH